jgi:hypothetical protein
VGRNFKTNKKNSKKLKNLLSRGGHATTRIFLNPCPKFNIVTRDEFVSLEAEEDP